MRYLPRVVDGELDALSRELPALALDGAKGVGKTATAEQRTNNVIRLDDPAQREIVAADVMRVVGHPGTVLLDEWQRLPLVWDVVRRAVDDGAPPGAFLLTGSALPADVPSHSGAGRIVRVRMRPLSLAERALTTPTVSLGHLLAPTDGSHPSPIAGHSPVELGDYVEEILASGFPGIRTVGGRARRAVLSGYLDRVVERDFPEQGLQLRRPQTMLAWLRAYAAASSTTTSYTRLLDAATPGLADKPAKTTTIAYREVLEQLWLVDPVPGWAPGRNQLHRLTQAPKLHLADPALAASLLGVGIDALLSGESVGPVVPRDGTLLGALFESLVTLSIRVYAQAQEARLFHLRTPGGRHEVDLVVEGPDRRVIGVEVKLGHTVTDSDVRHLHWLRETLREEVADLVVITTGAEAYRRRDGIAVVPAALLGP